MIAFDCSTRAYAQVATLYSKNEFKTQILQLVLTHRLQHGCRHRCNRVGTFNSCLRTGCNLVGNYNGNKDRAFNSCLRTGCNFRSDWQFRIYRSLQLVLTHRLQRVRQKMESYRCYPSTRAYAQVATCQCNSCTVKYPVLQLVLTHRLQPVQQHRDGNRAAFNSCLRTGCNFCMLYLEKCGLLPSTRAYAQVATFPTMTGRYRFEPFNSCLRTGCNARHQKERRQKAPSTRAYAQVATLALRGTIVAE